MNNADELMVSEKTAYNYLNAGLFDADKMDCPRIVRMRPRRAAPKLKIDRNCYEGRTYEDFTRVYGGQSRMSPLSRWTLSLAAKAARSF